MRTPRNARLVWTIGTGIAGVGLLGAAAFAGASSNAPSLPSHANSHASTAPSRSDSDSDSNEGSDSGRPSSTPVGPDATGPAAFGLCTAYSHAKAHGKSLSHSIAFRNLAAAAGGADKIEAYCATIPHPGSSEAPEGGAPSSVPSHSHPGGRPSSVPSHSHP